MPHPPNKLLALSQAVLFRSPKGQPIFELHGEAICRGQPRPLLAVERRQTRAPASRPTSTRSRVPLAVSRRVARSLMRRLSASRSSARALERDAGRRRMSGAGRTLTARAGACSSSATRSRASDAAPLPAEGAADKQQRPKQSKPCCRKAKGRDFRPRFSHTKRSRRRKTIILFFVLALSKRHAGGTKEA